MNWKHCKRVGERGDFVKGVLFGERGESAVINVPRKGAMFIIEPNDVLAVL